MLCITFDTDHLDDARMDEFLDDLDLPGRGTFFCTQRYQSLEGTAHELNPHPVLEKDSDWDRELNNMRELFPDASGWRSHSCVFSHLLAEWLANNNYRYASTNDQFLQRNIEPVRHPWGVWHMPIYYMDNMDLSNAHFWGEEAHEPLSRESIDAAVEGDALFVFDFHPIHLMLNSPNRDHYFAMRDRYKNGEPIKALRHRGYGVSEYYRDLCDALRAQNDVSYSLADALSAFCEGGEK